VLLGFGWTSTTVYALVAIPAVISALALGALGLRRRDTTSAAEAARDRAPGRLHRRAAGADPAQPAERHSDHGARSERARGRRGRFHGSRSV
jgi:hypothetical protein